MEVVDGAEVTVDVSCPACQEEVAAYSPQLTGNTDPEVESVNQHSDAITPVNEELPPFIQEIVAAGKTDTFRYDEYRLWFRPVVSANATDLIPSLAMSLDLSSDPCGFIFFTA